MTTTCGVNNTTTAQLCALQGSLVCQSLPTTCLGCSLNVGSSCHIACARISKMKAGSHVSLDLSIASIASEASKKSSLRLAVCFSLSL